MIGWRVCKVCGHLQRKTQMLKVTQHVQVGLLDCQWISHWYCENHVDIVPLRPAAPLACEDCK